MSDIATLSTRDKIFVLENELRKRKQVELPLYHYFAEGLYAREMRVPAGVMITGMIHSTETIGIMSKGRMVIWNDDGSRTAVDAPYTHVGKPGMKRVGYAIEDVVWTTIHKTDLTDLAEIEREQFVVADDNVSMFDFETGRVRDKALQDRTDFHLMLQEYGFDAETVREQSENTSDRVDIDLGKIGVTLSGSPIEGQGVFPTRAFKEGDFIGPARMNGFRTQLGRYTNHSCSPNAEMVGLDNGDINLVALKDIGSEEITTDYRHTLELRGITPINGGAKCLV